MNTAFEQSLPTNIFESPLASVKYRATSQTLLVLTKGSFIPGSEFKILFSKVGDFIKSEKVSKLIFDKTSLNVFDQASMTWYHLVWKPEMLKFGLKTYRKILPDNPLFRTSVQIGRDKIVRENPDWNLDQFDIRYCNSLEEAFQV
jgi:hypothetical protein